MKCKETDFSPLILILLNNVFCNLQAYCSSLAKINFIQIIHQIFCKRIWVFATNSDILIPLSLQPNVVNFWHFKLLIVLDQIMIVWNIKGLHNWIAKIWVVMSLWQILNSFVFLAQRHLVFFFKNMFISVCTWQIFLTLYVKLHFTK